ncbi:UNVERIFIED_CONTAM: hypothetical protein O8I53_08540 [Campylobacter lari]
MIKNKAQEYGAYIEDRKVIKRFGFAAKFLNLSRDINVVLFDQLNLFTPEYANFAELDKEYTQVALRGVQNVAINK